MLLQLFFWRTIRLTNRHFPKGRFVTQLTITNPYLGIAILVLFCVAGKIFRDNWKLKGANWKRNCWLSGLVATACFAVLAFIPFVPG